LLALGAAALLAAGLPFWSTDQYQVHLASLICCYWVLIAGLNLVVGYSGQLSIGHVGLLSIGAYTFAILSGKWGLPPFVSVGVAGALCGFCGLLLGLPSLRLPGFYFAMATMAFALIVGEFALAQGDLTGGGVGLPVPSFPAPFDTPVGFYYLAVLGAVVVSVLTWNVARQMYGRGLIAIRDNPVTAQAVGVPVFRAKLTTFVFSGMTAGVGGALFGSLQSYITPDTFHFELSLFFFVCIIIGGRGSIVGPFLGVAVLTALPEVVAPLAKLGNFFYGLLLLLVVLVVPEGIGRVFELIAQRLRPRNSASVPVAPDLPRLAKAIAAIRAVPGEHPLSARVVTKQFGAVVALDQVSLELRPGEIHGLIGPNGSGKTTLLNLLSGYYQPSSGAIQLRGEELGQASVRRRAQLGVARTFQKPRLLGTLSVLNNVVLGAWTHVEPGFLSTALGLPRVVRLDRVLTDQAAELLHGVGLSHAIERRANLLEHAEQRFLEIARGLAMRPSFILLDEPAGGLSNDEIEHLGDIIRTIREAGIGVLLVEHHTDFVFRVCDRVTTLDVGRMIRHGHPEDVRTDPEVIRVYLGA